MFSRPERLKQRTPKFEDDRFEYLTKLVKEFHTSFVDDSKEQILANLANFSYDPINYNFLRSLRVIDLFIDQLSETNQKLIQFAISGLCNLSNDPENQNYIIQKGGVEHISRLIFSNDVQTVLSALTILYNFSSASTESIILKRETINHVKLLSESNNTRIKNLACVFLENINSQYTDEA